MGSCCTESANPFHASLLIPSGDIDNSKWPWITMDVKKRLLLEQHLLELHFVVLDFSKYSLKLRSLDDVQDPACSYKIIGKALMIDSNDREKHVCLFDHEMVMKGRKPFIYIPNQKFLFQSTDRSDVLHVCFYVQKCNVPSERLELERLGQASDLRTMFRTGVGSNVSLIVRNRSFQMHKGVLSYNSVVFRQIFSEMEDKETILVINHHESDIIWAMLRYIYTKEMTDLGRDLKDLEKAAEEYMINDLREKCRELLDSQGRTIEFDPDKTMEEAPLGVSIYASYSEQMISLGTYLSRDDGNVILNVKDTIYTSHKDILSSKSKIFESIIESSGDYINIENYEPLIFEAILFHTYTGELMNYSTIVAQILPAACEYELHWLLAECETILISQMSVLNAFVYAFLAETYGLDRLNKCARALINEKIVDSADETQYDKLVKINLANILKFSDQNKLTKMTTRALNLLKEDKDLLADEEFLAQLDDHVDLKVFMFDYIFG